MEDWLHLLYAGQHLAEFIFVIILICDELVDDHGDQCLVRNPLLLSSLLHHLEIKARKSEADGLILSSTVNDALNVCTFFVTHTPQLIYILLDFPFSSGVK